MAESSLLFSAICVALMVGFIIAEALNRKELMDSSASVQEDLQTDSTEAKNFFVFIAYAALVVTFAVEAVAYYGVSARVGLPLVLVTALGASVSDLLKMIYCSPRPYWAYDEVEALSCEKGWGNPSGHALFTGTVWLCVSVLLLTKGKWIWTGLPILWILLVGFDRVYLGVHFYSQVLLGWSYSLGIAGLYLLILKLPVLEMTKHPFKVAIIYHILAFFYELIGVLLYVLRDPYWDEAWALRIQQKCSFSYSASNAQGDAFIESALFAFFPGAILGFAVVHKQLPSLQIADLPLKRRVILFVVSLLPLLLEGGICKKHAVMLSKSYVQAWGGWVLTLVVSYLAGVLFTAAVPLLRLLFPTPEPSPLARAVYDEK